MELTERQVRYVGLVGFVLVVLGTPVTITFAMDYRMVELGDTPRDPPVFRYQELDPETQTAVDRTIADEGPWYRTRLQAPFDEMPVYVVKGGDAHLLGLAERFHWAKWYGKLPLVVFLTGLSMVSFTLQDRIRNYVPTG